MGKNTTVDYFFQFVSTVNPEKWYAIYFKGFVTPYYNWWELKVADKRDALLRIYAVKQAAKVRIEDSQFLQAVAKLTGL